MLLTPKQNALLEFITVYAAQNGTAPSFDEMRQALGLQSKSGVHRLVQALVERGYLRQMKQRARALELVKQPAKAMIDAVAQAGQAVNQAANQAMANMLSIPLYGQIAAGSPITAISDVQDHIDVPLPMLPASRAGREFYALTVKGDSMVDVGILNGDHVIIERSNTARDGAIVVALVRNEEATLKRLQRQSGGKIALVAANPDHPTQIYPAHDVAVQGTLVGLMRSYG